MLFALLLGVLVALNPCQLAISISALTFLLRRSGGTHGGRARRVVLLYAAGRTLTYVALAWALQLLFGNISEQIQASRLFDAVETALPYFLVAVAVFFLFRAIRPHHFHGECHHSGQIIKSGGTHGAFVLGLLLAFAFCPESAVMYFGMMLPASFATAIPPLVPVCFAVGAAMPVLLAGGLMMRLAQSAVHFAHRMEVFQRVLNVLTAILFLGLAGWLLVAA